ncbi:MAG: DNA polymerase III subunit delta' [Deltaproteobacteria bacterium]|nr:MAG: DNA polymerase III subunit delta' [Deltaproteobacteria bacterium]
MAFRDIIGQERAIRALKKIVDREEVPHAFLFSGLPGIGKKTVAFNFAKVINCLNRIDNDCCEGCSACTRANTGNYPDLLLIETSEQFIGIDAIRSIEEELNFPPLEGRKRITIIDDAQKMTDEAANALLKTLEEPPSNNLIILICPEPAMLLPTVVSRTCHLRFQPLTERAVKDILVSRQFLDDKNAELIARVSSGSVDRALSYLESQYINRRELVKKRILEIFTCDINRLFEIAKEWGSEADFLLDDIDLLKMWWRDLIVYNLSSNREVVLDVETTGMLKEHLGKTSYVSLMKNYRLFDTIYNDLMRRINRQMAMERLVLGLRESINEKDSRSTL